MSLYEFPVFRYFLRILFLSLIVSRRNSSVMGLLFGVRIVLLHAFLYALCMSYVKALISESICLLYFKYGFMLMLLQSVLLPICVFG